MLVEEGIDRGFQFFDAAVHAASDLPFCQQGEKPLDLVQPGTTGLREVNMPAQALGQPVPDQLGLVRRVIVLDQMHIQPVRYLGLDLVQELTELRGAMAWIVFADDCPGGDAQGGEQ